MKETKTTMEESIEKNIFVPNDLNDPAIEMTLSPAKKNHQSKPEETCKPQKEEIRLDFSLTTIFRVAYTSQSNSTVSIRLFAFIADIWHMVRDVERYPCP